jgi:hypothetical protein
MTEKNGEAPVTSRGERLLSEMERKDLVEFDRETRERIHDYLRKLARASGDGGRNYVVSR